MNHSIGATISLLMGLFVTTVSAFAQSDAVLSLRGLIGVAVVIDPLEREAIDAGVAATDLRTDVELHLRRSGVKVLSVGELRESTGYPILHADVTFACFNSQNGLCYYSVQLKFQQAVVLTREKLGLSGMATTWDFRLVGGGGKNNVSRGIREGLGDLVDRFLNDYLAVNPK